MPSTYSPDLRIELMANGEKTGTWGTITNSNLGTLIEDAIAGLVTVSITSAAQALTVQDGAYDQARNAAIEVTTTTTANFSVFVPPVTKLYVFRNSSAYVATVYASTVAGNTTAAGTGVAVPAGKSVLLRCTGVNIVEQFDHVVGNFSTTGNLSVGGTITASALDLTAPLPAIEGGTGQSSYTTGDLVYASSSTAISKLADVATGNALISGGVGVAPAYGKIGLTTHVSGSLPITNGGTGATDAAGARTNLGLGTIATQNANSVAITGGSITGITALAATVGGTGQSSYAVGDLIYANTTTSIAKLADVATGNAIISGGVNAAPSYGKIGLTTHVSGVLPIANGGTNQTSYTDGQLLIGNTVGNTLTKATLTAGSGVSITNGNGSITIASTGPGGTLTSVAQSFTGGLISVSGSPITTSGTLALTVAGTSGGIPYFSSGTTWATSAALAANALVVGGGAGIAPSTITTGTGVTTALGVNTGSAGAVVINGGALGTPSSGTVTNLTGTASININGTVGATTANTGAFTTLTTSSTATFSGNVSGVIKSGTAQTSPFANTSSIDFTGIPSTAKQVTVMINSLSFAAAGVATIQLGSGSLLTSGYTSNNVTLTAAATTTSTQTNGFGIINLSAASVTANVMYIITNITGNTWSFSSQLYKIGDAAGVIANGFVALGGALDRLSVVATTSTFDGGTVNIMWE